MTFKVDVEYNGRYSKVLDELNAIEVYFSAARPRDNGSGRTAHRFLYHGDIEDIEEELKRIGKEYKIKITWSL